MSKSKQTTFQFVLLGTVYIAANRSVSARVPLTATYVSTNAQIRQWLKVESESNHLYDMIRAKLVVTKLLNARCT